MAPKKDQRQLTVPGSASTELYLGSRLEAQRFSYSWGSRSGMAELAPGHVMTPDKLFQALRNVPGVLRVVWNTSKTLQGNIGDHAQESNCFVYSKNGDPKQPFEFEVTRNNHTKDTIKPVTVTVMFKDPPEGRDWEAWRILRAVVKGKELLPQLVQQYMVDSLARHGGAPGSASAPASQGAAADADAAQGAQAAPQGLAEEGAGAPSSFSTYASQGAAAVALPLAVPAAAGAVVPDNLQMALGAAAPGSASAATSSADRAPTLGAGTALPSRPLVPLSFAVSAAV